jgi:hypothetical protein
LIKTYNRINFHNHTFCVWKEVSFDEIQSLKINYKSKSGSQYIFTEKGLFRISNHWGRVADCHWRLIPLAEFKNQNITVAFANWVDFFSNDDAEKLFYIKVDLEMKEVNFYHKLTAETTENLILRNAKETAKTIRIIREVLSQTDWAKYLSYDDFEMLRKEIVSELVTTTKSFLEIKKHYLG